MCKSVFEEIVSHTYCGMTLRGFTNNGKFNVLSIIFPSNRLTISQAMALVIRIEKGDFERISFYNPSNLFRGIDREILLNKIRRIIPLSIIPSQGIESMTLLRKGGKSIKFISSSEETPKGYVAYKLPISLED